MEPGSQRHTTARAAVACGYSAGSREPGAGRRTGRKSCAIRRELMARLALLSMLLRKVRLDYWALRGKSSANRGFALMAFSMRGPLARGRFRNQLAQRLLALARC